MRNKLLAIAAIATAMAIPIAAQAQSETVGVARGGSVVIGETDGITADQRPAFREYIVRERVPTFTVPDRVIVGGSVMDNGYNDGNPSGVIRAYNAVTGTLVWNFDPANPDMTQPIAADQTYPQDTPVAWGTLTADMKNGLVFVPFGNASPDELGINRDPNSNTEKFRDTLVALDLNTGAFKWKFQTSHNDLWDRDNPSQPTLMEVGKEGSKQPALLCPPRSAIFLCSIV